jgi:ubiquinone/menaquinone biosynthesis C-methylase UbiE
MSSSEQDLLQLKARMRSTWMAGDFGQIAQYATDIAEEFVGRLDIQPRMKVLDAACGTGNLAIPAARRGATVTGVDIAPNLLDQARSRALSEGWDIRFDEGDVEQMPYEDLEFDLVISMFGAMFAPRPDKTASELMRVCRSGGTVAMANWTREGFAGEMFALGARYVTPPPGVPAPVLWGNDQVIRQRFDGLTAKVETVRRTIRMDFPFSPTEMVQFFLRYFGPTQLTFARLDPDGQSAYATDLTDLWIKCNEATDGTTSIRNEYLEVIATKS